MSILTKVMPRTVDRPKIRTRASYTNSSKKNHVRY